MRTVEAAQRTTSLKYAKMSSWEDDEDFFSEADEEEENFAFDAADVAAANVAQAQYVIPEEFKIDTVKKTNSVVEMFRTILMFVLLPIDLLFGIAITIVAELISLVIDILNYALQAIARNIKEFLLTVFNALVTGVFTTLQIFLCTIIAPLTGLLFCSIGAVINGVLWGINALFIGIREAICGITKGLFFIFTGLDAVFQALYDLACSAIDIAARVLTVGADKSTGFLEGTGDGITLHSVATGVTTAVRYTTMPLIFVTEVATTGVNMISGQVDMAVNELGMVDDMVKTAESGLPQTGGINGVISSIFGLANSLVGFVVEYIPYIMLFVTFGLIWWGTKTLVKAIKKRSSVDVQAINEKYAYTPEATGLVRPSMFQKNLNIH